MTKQSPPSRLAELTTRSTLQLTTRGRKTGKRHTVTVWFLVDGRTLYLVTLKLRRDWPRNVAKNGDVELEIAGHTFKGHATQIVDAKRLDRIRALLAEKYWAAWLGAWFGVGPEGAFLVTLED